MKFRKLNEETSTAVKNEVDMSHMRYAVIKPNGEYAGVPCESFEEARDMAAQEEGRVVFKLSKVVCDESFEMAVGGDDFDGEIAAMRAEQAELEARRADRKERFALMHKLFDKHIDKDPNAHWIDKLYDLFEDAESVVFIGNKYGTLPGRTEDGQPIRYRYSIEEYDIYTDPYRDYIYIGTNNDNPLVEDLEDEFDLLMKASELKCKLSRYDIDEASNEDELIIYMEDVYNILVDEYGAENIKWWKFYEDDDVDFGYKVCLKDGSKHIVEINNDRVDEINEAVEQEEADVKPQYIICGVTNEGTRMFYDAVNDNFTTDYDAATKYDDMDVARDDWFKIPRTGFRRIFIPIYAPAVFETLTEKIDVGNLVTHVDDGDKTRGTVVSINNDIAKVCVGDPSNKDYVDVPVDKLELDESFDVDNVLKRIAHVDEFDNGHVFFEYENMTSAQAEEKARRMSLEDPSKTFYVKYDDIMNPCSDIKWKNGEQLLEDILDDNSVTDSSLNGDDYDADERYFVYDDTDNAVSDGYCFEEDAIDFAQSNGYPVVKVHRYFYDERGKIRPDGYPEEIWHG